MSETPDQRTINALVQKLRPKPQAPKTAQSNGHHHAAGSADASPPSDIELLEKLFSEPEGQKWRDVYGGDWGPYYDSQSSADAAILYKLAFWTNRDSGQMERIITNPDVYFRDEREPKF